MILILVLKVESMF